MPAGIPKIQVKFQLDADGILMVKATELRSGVDHEITIKSQYGISEEEMAKMLLDSIKNAKTDMNQKAILEAKNEANNIIVNTKRFLSQNENWLSKSEESGIREKLRDLQEVIKGNNKDAINTQITAINDFTRPIAEKALDKAIQESLTGKSI